jgi:hypothetical protein
MEAAEPVEQQVQPKRRSGKRLQQQEAQGASKFLFLRQVLGEGAFLAVFLSQLKR